MATKVLTVDAVMVDDTPTEILTVPAAKDYNISMIRFTNIDTTDHQLTVWNYAPGSSEAADDTTAELFDMTIQPKQTFEFGPLLLPPGRVVSAQADAAGFINARVHGWETDI